METVGTHAIVHENSSHIAALIGFVYEPFFLLASACLYQYMRCSCFHIRISPQDPMNVRGHRLSKVGKIQTPIPGSVNMKTMRIQKRVHRNH